MRTPLITASKECWVFNTNGETADFFAREAATMTFDAYEVHSTEEHLRSLNEGTKVVETESVTDHGEGRKSVTRGTRELPVSRQFIDVFVRYFSVVEKETLRGGRLRQQSPGEATVISRHGVTERKVRWKGAAWGSATKTVAERTIQRIMQRPEYAVPRTSDSELELLSTFIASEETSRRRGRPSNSGSSGPKAQPTNGTKRWNGNGSSGQSRSSRGNRNGVGGKSSGGGGR